MPTYLLRSSCGVAEHHGVLNRTPEEIVKNYIKDCVNGLDYSGTKYKGHAFCVFSSTGTKDIDNLCNFLKENKLGKCYKTKESTNRAHGKSVMTALLFAPDWDKMQKYATEKEILLPPKLY